MAEVIHAHRVAAQYSATIDGPVQSQRQFLHQMAIGGIQLVNHTLQQGVGTHNHRVSVRAGDVDEAVVHHRCAGIGVAIGLTAPHLGGVGAILDPEVHDVDIVNRFILHAIGCCPSAGNSRCQNK